MDVNVMIDLTERTVRAIRDLCAALTADKMAASPVPETPTAPVAPTSAPTAVPAAPVTPTAPAAPQNPAPTPTSAPVQPPVQAPAPPVAPAAVPLSQAPAFTKAQVASAGAALIQADPSKKEPLQALLAQYGVPSVADLPEEHVGTFATALRGLGANI